MGGLLGRCPVWPALRDRRREVGHPATPRDALERGSHEGDRLVRSVVGPELDRRVEVLEVTERERPGVAVELEPASGAWRPMRRSSPSAAGRAALELDRGHDQVGAADAERTPIDRHPVRHQVPAPRAHGRRGPTIVVTRVSG